jgi:hypothetical protein
MLTLYLWQVPDSLRWAQLLQHPHLAISRDRKTCAFPALIFISKALVLMKPMSLPLPHILCSQNLRGLKGATAQNN